MAVSFVTVFLASSIVATLGLAAFALSIAWARSGGSR